MTDLYPVGYALASSRVAVDKQPVLFMYRELPDNDEDSGWRFFSGMETQAEMDDPDNIGMYAVSTIVAIDSSVAPLLMTRAPCAFERADSGEPFRPAEGLPS